LLARLYFRTKTLSQDSPGNQILESIDGLYYYTILIIYYRSLGQGWAPGSPIIDAAWSDDDDDDEHFIGFRNSKSKLDVDTEVWISSF